jgi:hypothetical protein
LALLTATELQNSAEAAEAGVSAVSDAAATSAIQEAEAALYAYLGYEVQTTTTEITIRGSGAETVWLPLRARTVSAVEVDGVALETDAYRPTIGGFALRGLSEWAASSDFVITGTFGFAATDHEYILARRAVRMLAVRYLSSTNSTEGFPQGGAGSFMTGYSTEGAQFQFFTPEGDEDGTGYADIDRIARQIGIHPRKRKNVLKSVALRSSAYSSTADVDS